ncbi:DUF2147 domain-containing protein [Pseudotabrizicola algicola]|uniref:DUF2147 domain-containing protein n=1 Tax=Pseudotabrizicola algicola TaxID=2709381 RepID=A0A6B3RQ21_9RHOB|nr:DUF2147 domain-containing protein [Pseudotabrizicola algicola]NEX47353.1 DUF2147 domain-containing protein [Pseudotabrizicola algicola]
MNRFAKQVAMAAALVMCAGTAFAEPIVGLWQTQEDDGAYAHVQIAPCGANFCGTIVKTFKAGAEYKSENLGKQLVRDMAAKGGGAYEGKVWRPSNNKIYMGKIAVNGTAMKLSGCVAGGLICSKQDWKKIK